MSRRDCLHQQAARTWLGLTLWMLLTGVSLGTEPGPQPDPVSHPALTDSDRPVEHPPVPPALFDFIGEFSDSDADWADPTELDDWMFQSVRTPGDRFDRSPSDLEQESEPDEH